MLSLALFVGMSDMLGGYDRYIYGELFDNIADITKSKGTYKDAYIYVLYPTFCYLISQLIGISLY